MNNEYINRKIEKLVHYSPIISALIIVAYVQLLDLFLLIKKYNLFTGGFLQPYAFTSALDRLVFALLSGFFDITFYVMVCGFVWILLARLLGKKSVLVIFNYLFLSCALFTLWTAAKYKILTYFSDAIDFTIAKNLAGGSLSEALAYVVNESLFIFVFIGIAIAFYLFIFKLLKPYRRIKHGLADTGAKKMGIIFALIFVISAPVIYFVNSDGFLRYGLIKKTSFVLMSDFFDALSDFDRDGYGVFKYPRDMQPFNASVYPYAIDTPSNGIDEDGLAGDSYPVAEGEDSMQANRLQLSENIVLVVLESARSDILVSSVNGKAVTPTLRQIAENGVSVPRVYSHTGYTTSSIKALLNRTILDAGNKVNLLDLLQAKGYALNFISGQDESFGNINSTVGMDKQGRYLFDARSALDDRVYPSTDPGSLRLSEKRVVRAINERLNVLNEINKPFFMYINFQAAHFPYSHPYMPKRLVENFIPRAKILPENRRWLRETYLNAISVADDAISQVVTGLKQRGLWNNTILIVTGDHGESLFDDGFLGHGHAINDEQTLIPLVVNRAFVPPVHAMGQIDILSWVVSSLMGTDNKIKTNNSNGQVFQIVGPLARPKMIGFVDVQGERTTYDFRADTVFDSSLEKWLPLGSVLSDEVRERATALINYWESLRRAAPLSDTEDH